MVGLALLWGLVSGAAFTVVVLLSWRLTPEVWLADVTNGARRSPVTVVTVTWFVLVVLSFVGGGVAAAWLAASRFEATFVEAALVAYAAMAIVNLIDLVVVDIVVYLWMRPSWMTLPGVEMPTDYAMHLRGAVNGLVLAVPLAAAAAALSLAA